MPRRKPGTPTLKERTWLYWMRARLNPGLPAPERRTWRRGVWALG